jgi:mRNA-degrading endonuclease toxin of MazEF toxin-antitoxin module
MAKSFTIEPEINEYVASTKGAHSASGRVNQLLRRAIIAEKYERLETEAEAFLAVAGEKERSGARAFQAAALRTFARH